jgi:hypothetical protein
MGGMTTDLVLTGQKLMVLLVVREVFALTITILY